MLLLAASRPASAQSSIQRYLASLRLGDGIKQIEMVYPPTRKWQRQKEPKGGVVRIRIEREDSEWFPAKVKTVLLGMRRGRLVHIRLVYDKEYSRQKPFGELAVDLSLIYGEPRRYRESYFWWDSSTVLAVAKAEIKTEKGQELRTSQELMERSYFGPFKK
ncbi:MAG: hypothetical protein ABIJ96_01295 [Elusimicrobiota bacterium]